MTPANNRKVTRQKAIQNNVRKNSRSAVIGKRKEKSAGVQRSEQLQKKREAERQKRQKIKEDPEQYELYCQKERERNRKRKVAGKVKTVDQLTEREKQIRRGKQKEWKRNSRSKQIESSSDQPITTTNNNVLSKQAKVGKKRIAKNMRKCYRDKSRLQLKKNVDKLRKRVSRLKMKKSTSTSSASTVNKFLKNRRVDDDVKKKLIAQEALVQQLRAAYRDSKGIKFKQVLARVLSGNVIKKYRQLTFVKKHLAPVVSSRIHRSQESLEFVRKQKGTFNFVKGKIKQFFDENSQVDPGKRNCKSVNGELISRRHMNASVQDLYSKFCAETTFRVSYPFFAKNRPSYCIAPKVSERNTCACFTHENFNLLAVALHRVKILQENSAEKLIKQVTCTQRVESCISRTCQNCIDKQVQFDLQHINLNDSISYMKWETSAVKRTNEKTHKPITVSITKKSKLTCTIQEALDLFKEKFKLLMAHEHRIIHQQQTFKKLKENLKSDEMILLMDFSENYSCKYETEVQSVHFGASREQCTLHTGMMYTSSVAQGFTTLSKSLRHDPPAIMAHLKKILDTFLSNYPTIEKLHFMSDGPTTQYRNRKMFYLMTQYLPQCYPQIVSITYNFSEAGHGKSPADGIGGRLKKIADDQVKYGHDIPDFETLGTIDYGTSNSLLTEKPLKVAKKRGNKRKAKSSEIVSEEVAAVPLRRSSRYHLSYLFHFIKSYFIFKDFLFYLFQS